MKIVWEKELTEEQKEEIINSNKFKNWYEKAKEEFNIESINIQSVDFFGNKVGFIKLKAEIKDKEGHRIPGITFIRGNSVSVMLNIKNTDTNEDYVALVVQGRVPIATANCFESPAGMMDEEENIVGVAIKEVEEELHMKIEAKNLIPLTEVYTSPGGQDEKISIFAYEHKMTQKEIDLLNGKRTGEEGSNEKIKVKIIPLKDFLKYNKSAAGQLAYRTYMMEVKNK